jgi:hypothetical protein
MIEQVEETNCVLCGSLYPTEEFMGQQFIARSCLNPDCDGYDEDFLYFNRGFLDHEGKLPFTKDVLCRFLREMKDWAKSDVPPKEHRALMLLTHYIADADIVDAFEEGTGRYYI